MEILPSASMMTRHGTKEAGEASTPLPPLVIDQFSFQFSN